MKKAVILGATGGELANQLWNYASIYAYCLERGYALENPAFFEYGNYFSQPAPNLFFKLFFFLPFTNYTKRKNSFKRRLWRKIYAWYAQSYKTPILVSDNKENQPFYLPPTKESLELSAFEKTTDTIYFDGWLFRNPIGLQKYRKEVTAYLKPRQNIEEATEKEMTDLRGKFKNIIGVHVRQGDYKVWRDGEYFIPQTRVREILDGYIKTSSKNIAETCFIITSDGLIDASLFDDYNIFVSKNNPVHDLFLLSKTAAIIGSDSTFGAFASYYGNIPFLVMKKESMDWEYYQNKKEYFENKYSSFVHY